jgi:hypothetical protein
MKKQLLLGILALVFSAGVFAQEGTARQTPEERTKATIEKLAPLNLTADQATKASAVLTDFYSAQQKAVEEMRAAGNADRTAFQAKRKELSDARDAKLKEIFTADQLKQWTEIEPTLRPQRQRPGGK